MAQTFKWVAPEAIATALTTELNSLANAAVSSLSSAIDNETDLFQFMNVEVVLASLTPTNAFLALLLVPTVDGTNYLDSTSQNLDRFATTLIMDTAASAKRIGKENIPIPPLKFKLAIYNGAGPALASSGNTLKYRRHNGQAV